MTTSEIPVGTGSRATRLLGIAALAATALFLLMALVISPPDVSQKDAVRLFYLHVPSATVSLYFAFGTVAIGSVMYLWKQSTFWDLAAGSAAEIGTLFCGYTLLSGMLWGRPTWGVYWQWEARLTTTTISFVLFCGYLAIRRLDMDPAIRSQRAAILGLIAFANTFLVRYSVEYWRGLHQGTTLDPIDTKMTGSMLGTFFLGLFAFTLIFVWLMIHRFRLAWIEHELEEIRLEKAIAERRAEASAGVGSDREDA